MKMYFLNGFDYFDNNSILYSNLCKDGFHINKGESRQFAINFYKIVIGLSELYYNGRKNPPKADNTRKRHGLKIAFPSMVCQRKTENELGIIFHDNETLIS